MIQRTRRPSRRAREKLAKAEQKKIIDLALDYLSPIAVDRSDAYGMLEWTVETKYGPLRVMVPKEVVELPTIFSRFAEPERAAGHLRSNPYSGKWNFHGGDAGIFDDFKRSLDKILLR